MSRFAYTGNATNTASSTLPMANIVATNAKRPKIYHLIVGCDASPSNNAASFAIQRGSTAGTAGSSPTPTPLDYCEPSPTCTAGLAVFSVGPTLTASNFPLKWAQNQQAWFQWQAASMDYAIFHSAVAGNSLNLMALVATSPANYVFTMFFEE